MDFSIHPELQELSDRVRDFVDEVAIPAEQRDLAPGHGPSAELRAELQEAARSRGIFAPHVGSEHGGLGLDVRGQSIVFEEAGRSLLGPLALNCAAPDEGNMSMLERVASPSQVQQFLTPLARGDVRSCFAMTEPAPGAGSDPSMLQTTATRVDDGWAISGEKWFITGGSGAAFAIIMAATPGGATMFLAPTDTPGFTVTEQLDTIDRISPGGHARIELDEVFVPDVNVLGEVDQGFQYAQVRLAPARLTHCMRWLGIARRSLEHTVEYVAGRDAFGSKLAALGMAQKHIADAVIDIETSRAIIARTAWVLDTTPSGSREGQLASSIAKVHVSEAVGRVVDSCVQLCGATGILEDPLGRILAEVRPFRIYDGSNETHRWSIARRTVRSWSQRDAPAKA
jgi:acyl-CoA dehydrogenase